MLLERRVSKKFQEIWHLFLLYSTLLTFWTLETSLFTLVFLNLITFTSVGIFSE